MNAVNLLDGVIRDGLPASILARSIISPDPTPRIREVWLAIRTDGVPDPLDLDPNKVVIIGDGTRDNPWDASTALKFDSIMRVLLGTNTTIRLGPGVFRTGGSGPSEFLRKWPVRSGQRFVGSGKYQTTLLLACYDYQPTSASISEVAIFSSYSRQQFGIFLEGFQIEDMTLDCGMDDQPLLPGPLGPGFETIGVPRLSCTAAALAGRNIAIRRVRIINFGTRNPVVINGKNQNRSTENFPVGLYSGGNLTAGQVSFGHLLEDVILEQPFHSDGRETTPVNTGPGYPIDTEKGLAMRRCFFNTESAPDTNDGSSGTRQIEMPKATASLVDWRDEAGALLLFSVEWPRWVFQSKGASMERARTVPLLAVGNDARGPLGTAGPTQRPELESVDCICPLIGPIRPGLSSQTSP